MSDHRSICVQGADTGLVLTTDPKPRLRWTAELHERFIDAVSQLGGPDKATPKTIMKVMGVKGLTLYHLKSHLQKFRLGKQPHKDFNDQGVREGEKAFAFQRDAAATSRIMGHGRLNENIHQNEVVRMQMEVRRRLNEQLEVQRHLQMRIDAQGKYMQTILEKACRTVSEENGNNSHQLVVGSQGFGDMDNNNNIGSLLNLPSLDDLHINPYHNNNHHHLQQLQDIGSSSFPLEDDQDDFKVHMAPLTTDHCGTSTTMNFMPRSS